jgi:glycosyltransferase involved in cell wall biosynthesis
MQAGRRILVFSTDDHLHPAGGAEQAFGHITKRLPHLEFDLVCAKLRPAAKRHEVVGNVHIHRIGLGIPKFDGLLLALFGANYARRLARVHQYTFVWSIMASYGAFAAVAVKRELNLPFLLTLQEGDSFQYIEHRVRFVRGRFAEIFREAHAIQAISHYLLNWGRTMGFRGSSARVIPNGVERRIFSNTFSKEEVEKTRAAFGFSHGARVLITTSRLEEKNGVDDLIQSLTFLPAETCLVICGDGSLYGALTMQVERLGLRDRVKFLGFKKPEEIPLLLAASDCFVRPSRSEGLGTAFLEAMAARIPVVGTPVGGIPDFLIHGETGFFAQPRDPESIAEAIDTVCALSIEERTNILDRAERLVAARHDWDEIAKSMEVLFDTLHEGAHS